MTSPTKNAPSSRDSAPAPAPVQVEESKLSEMRARVNSWNISPPIVVGLASVLLLIALAVAFQFQPARVTATTTDGLQADTPDIVWLRGKVRETGGDISRLSPQDRAKADEAARRITGMGASALFSSPNALAPVDPNTFQAARTAAWRASHTR